MIAALSSASATPDVAARHGKLVDAAQQFEAVFLQQMLKSTAPDGQEQGAGQDDSGGGSQTYSSFGTEAVAKAIASAGGLGVARQIVRQVEHAAAGRASAENLSTQR